jgi:hypothetical protein
MSRQLDNLKRIFSKLQARYGNDDAIVSDFKQELEFRERVESGYQQWPDSNTQGIPGHFTQRRPPTVSGRTSALVNTP